MSNTQERNPMDILLSENSSSDIDILSTQHDAKRLPTSSPAMCVKCGANHHKNDCASSFSNLCCINCGGEHTASNLNCPKCLQYIQDNPKPYISYKKPQQEKLRSRKQANTHTSPGLCQAPPMPHQPIPQFWPEAVNQEHDPTYADVVKTQEPKPTKSVPQISNSILAKAFQPTPLENSNARSSITHYLLYHFFSQQLTVETPVLSIEIFFTLLHHILNYYI